MGQQQSQNKDELLYQQVNYGNVEGIKSLRQDGARLEWIDKEGKTPLIAACLNAELFHVAQTLIELGANVNAYRPGSHAGTPLHHASKRGLERTVKLLLSRGANPFVINDDCQTPLDVARDKGHTKIVRTIEHQISPFYGCLRELHGPGFLEAFASQWLTKRIWAVVIPCAPRNPAKPLRLQLAIYSTPQDAQPRQVISLWKAKIQEPKFNQADPTVVILDDHTKTRYKFASENEGDKQQLQLFYNACFGISQVMPPLNTTSPLISATAPPTTTEDLELAMALNASVHSAMVDEAPVPHGNPGSGNDWNNFSQNDWDSCGGPATGSSSSATQQSPSVPPVGAPSIAGGVNSGPSAVPQGIPETVGIPSAPPIPDGEEYGPVHYPTIDSTPVELPVPQTDGKEAISSDANEGSASSSCVICWDAPIEGACIPCGHMAGCLSCLNEVKAKKWGCPVCRAKIQQVVRLYAV